MNGRDGFGLPRLSSGVDDKINYHPIMLRFRPIAPKPATGELVSDSGATQGSKILLAARKRAKRKYVRVRSRNNNSNNNNRQCNKARKNRSAAAGEGIGVLRREATDVTLQLLSEEAKQQRQPQTVGFSHGQGPTITPPGRISENPDPWFDFKSDMPLKISVANEIWSDPRVASPLRGAILFSSLTVERVGIVGDPCMEGVGQLGCRDEERMQNLLLDTCPGLVSDFSNRVIWVNRAYARLAGGGSGKGEQCEWSEIAVKLATKEALPTCCGAFTCQVRMVNTWRDERWSKTVPCDVWRLDFGGFAWRLDVKAALGLGLGL